MTLQLLDINIYTVYYNISAVYMHIINSLDIRLKSANTCYSQIP